ncbi:MAG: hypothetical protein ACI8UO_000951 [Verrucomicrobiales bacterium]|jgi:hypothetical protein
MEEYPTPPPTNTPAISEKTLIGAALVAAPAAIGCGIGILLGNGLKRGSREGLAMTLFALGAAAAVPAAVDYIKRIANAPKTRRGSDRRLSAIRDGDVAFEDAFDYGAGAVVDDHSDEFRQEA